MDDGERLGSVANRLAYHNRPPATHAGWEILRVGAVSQASFAEIMEPCDLSGIPSGATLIPA
jgi:hypothetical protein